MVGGGVETRERGGGSGLGVPARRRLAWGLAMEKGAGTRRRRLVERGSDRLAFITGQTRSLSCDPIPGNPRESIR